MQMTPQLQFVFETALHAGSGLLLANMMYLLSVAIDQSVVLLEYNVYVNYWKMEAAYYNR